MSDKSYKLAAALKPKDRAWMKHNHIHILVATVIVINHDYFYVMPCKKIEESL